MQIGGADADILEPRRLDIGVENGLRPFVRRQRSAAACRRDQVPARRLQTGMAELPGEHLLSPRLVSVGVLIPFGIAAVVKTLQGSSLVAAVTAAGMVGPMLSPLGLGEANGRALAALAVGAGAMTISHVNDEYFWLVTRSARLSSLRGVATFGTGTLLQGLIAAAILLTIATVASHF